MVLLLQPYTAHVQQQVGGYNVCQRLYITNGFFLLVKDSV